MKVERTKLSMTSDIDSRPLRRHSRQGLCGISAKRYRHFSSISVPPTSENLQSIKSIQVKILLFRRSYNHHLGQTLLSGNSNYGCQRKYQQKFTCILGSLKGSELPSYKMQCRIDSLHSPLLLSVLVIRSRQLVNNSLGCCKVDCKYSNLEWIDLKVQNKISSIWAQYLQLLQLLCFNCNKFRNCWYLFQ